MLKSADFLPDRVVPLPFARAAGPEWNEAAAGWASFPARNSGNQYANLLLFVSFRNLAIWSHFLSLAAAIFRFAATARAILYIFRFSTIFRKVAPYISRHDINAGGSNLQPLP